MKIEDLIKLPNGAICEYNTKIYQIHIDPKSGNEIRSWFDNKGHLIKRFISDGNGNGFEIYYSLDNRLLWLYLVKEGICIYENKVAIGRFS